MFPVIAMMVMLQYTPVFPKYVMVWIMIVMELLTNPSLQFLS